MLMRISLRYRLFLALLLCALLTHAAAGMAILNRIEAGSRSEMLTQARASGRAVQALYQQRARDLQDTAQAIAVAPPVAEAYDSGGLAQLDGWLRLLPGRLDLSWLAATDAEGRPLLRTDDSLPTRPAPWAGIAPALNGLTAVSTEGDLRTEPALIGFAPVERNGRVVGVIVAAERLDLQFIQRLKRTAASGVEIALTTITGRTLRDPASTTGVPPLADDDLNDQARTAVIRGGEYNALRDSGSRTYGAFAWALRDPPGNVVAIVGVSTALGDLAQVREAAVADFWKLGLLVLVFNIAVAWILSRALIQPLRRLTAAVTAFAGGQYETPTHIRAAGELGQLADAFEEMRQRVAASTRALQREKDQVNAVLDATDEGILMVDAEGKLAVANRRWEELFGLNATELTGRPAAELERALGGCLAAARDLLGFEDRVVDCEQTRPAHRILRRYAAPVRTDQGQTIGRVLVFRDVTQERAADQVKAALISTVSHELRSPLAVIKGYARTLLLDDDWDVATRREFLQSIDAESSRLQALVENLLDLSQLEAGALPIDKQPVSLASLAGRVVERLERSGPGPRLTLRFADDLPAVLADPARIDQVLANLVENARKYAPADSTVELWGEERAGEVVVGVTDQGPGIPPEHLPRVFERFYRVDNSLSRKVGGTGLGLAIARGLVEAHGGRIWAMSDGDGRGSTFAFALPAAVGELV